MQQQRGEELPLWDHDARKCPQSRWLWKW